MMALDGKVCKLVAWHRAHLLKGRLSYTVFTKDIQIY